MIRWPVVAAIVVGVVHATTVAAIAVGLPQEFRAPAARDHPSCIRIADPERRERCEASTLPASYSPMDMGRPDYGTPVRSGRHVHSGSGPRSTASPALPGTPQRVDHADGATGRQVIGGVEQPVLTFNGTTPGPDPRPPSGGARRGPAAQQGRRPGA